MYTNASQAIFDCDGIIPDDDVCSVGVNDVFPDAPDTCDNNATFFASESDDSLRKIVYQLKRCTNPDDPTTFVTAVHHLETPANIDEGFNMMLQRLTVGPVWGTEVEFQQFHKDNPDIVAIRISDDPGPDGKALNRSDDVNYLAAKIDTANEKNNRAARGFLKFLRSPETQFILEFAGFIPATADELDTTIPLP